MGVSYLNLMVTGDHAVPVEPLGGTAIVSVLSGGPVYYQDSPAVSPQANQGSITVGAQASFTNPVWIVSSVLSSVRVELDPAPPAVTSKPSAGPFVGQGLFWNGSAWVPAAGNLGFPGKVWAACGTSITAYDSYTAAMEMLCGSGDGGITNLGIGGATLSNNGANNGSIYITELPAIPANADIITIEAGINDFRLNIPLGTIADTAQATSFYGALNATCTWLRTNRPSAQVYFLTPHGTGTGDAGSTGNWKTANTLGATLAQFWTAIQQVANMFGYPVLNVGAEAGIGGATLETLINDQVHLAPLGAYRMAQYLRAKMLDIPYYIDPVGVPGLSAIVDTTKTVIGSWGVDQFGTLFCGANRSSAHAYSGLMFAPGVVQIEFTQTGFAAQTSGMGGLQGGGWAVVGANTTYAAALGPQNINQIMRFTLSSGFFDTGTNITLTGTILRRTRVQIFGGKVRVKTSNGPAAAFTQNYPDQPSAVTDGVPALNAIIGTSAAPTVQLGVLQPFAADSPAPVGYDFWINNVPINQVLQSGSIPTYTPTG